MYNTEGLCNDSQLWHRGYMRPIDHLVTGMRPVADVPSLDSTLPKATPTYAQARRLGEQNDDILGSLLELSAAAIARLRLKEAQRIC